MAPLPYEVSKMATVRWGDNIVIVGGADKHDKALDTVIYFYLFIYLIRLVHITVAGNPQQRLPITAGPKVIIYNVKTEQSHSLPSMRCKRWGCTAVVIGNNIVVLGGDHEREGIFLVS